jgi:hypothetical protein
VSLGLGSGHVVAAATSTRPVVAVGIGFKFVNTRLDDAAPAAAH